MTLTEQTHQIITTAIEAVQPHKLMPQKVFLENSTLKIDPHAFDLSRYENIYVIGAGKASGYMAQALEAILNGRIADGAVVVKYAHGAPCKRIRMLEGGHPILDANGLKASEEVLRLAQKAGTNDLVITLISGGGSALLEKLPDEVQLTDLQRTFQLLLESGASIEEINAVRKHLSLVKGGQLARAISPACAITLIISDVIGDPLEAIASGPTAPDSSTFQDAWAVAERYGLEEKLPTSVKNYLQKGLRGEVPETLKPGDAIFEKVHNIILGNNASALLAAEENARRLGYQTLVLTSRLQGEAREVARVLAAILQEELANSRPAPRPTCILLGGETTVTIRGKGLGGRNQELALAALLAMKGVRQPFVFASCGTDGTDGPTDAAGGLVFPEMWERIQRYGLNPEVFLHNNDAYHFLEQVGGLIKTGPTGTNVMDIVVALVP